MARNCTSFCPITPGRVHERSILEDVWSHVGGSSTQTALFVLGRDLRTFEPCWTPLGPQRLTATARLHSQRIDSGRRWRGLAGISSSGASGGLGAAPGSPGLDGEVPVRLIGQKCLL